MANKKFSEFDLKTSSSDVAFVVGFNGTDNVRIAPSNLSSGGASDLNGLSDCSVTAEFSQFIGNVPSGVTSGNAFYNTSLGHNALESLTGGAYNTVIGFEAGDAITTNNRNTVFGAQALSSSNPASVTAIGQMAGNAASGSNAVYVGYQAGRNNTSSGHISIGYQAGSSNTSGTKNVSIGYQAGYTNTVNSNNTCIGYEAGEFNTGNANTFIGNQAGQGITFPSGATGRLNTCVGSGAGTTLTTGIQNVIIGAGAAGPTAGSNNTIIGVSSSIGNTLQSNVTLLGFGAIGSGGSNEITLGNSSVSTLRCAVTSITSLSDERDKSEIKDITYGLDFIDGLQPREFVWDNRPETDGDGEEFYSANKGKKDFGFIAQEVQALDNDTLRLVYDENPEKLELSYGKLVPVLVQAIKELKAKVTALENA